MQIDSLAMKVEAHMVAVFTQDILSEALGNAEAAITIFGEERRFLAVNDRYLEITGYTREEIDTHRVGENLALDPLEEDEFMAMNTTAISAGETDIVLKNGEPSAVEYVVIPTQVEDERLFIGMFWPLVPQPE